jgi:hypothetical protein
MAYAHILTVVKGITWDTLLSGTRLAEQACRFAERIVLLCSDARTQASLQRHMSFAQVLVADEVPEDVLHARGIRAKLELEPGDALDGEAFRTWLRQRSASSSGTPPTSVCSKPLTPVHEPKRLSVVINYCSNEAPFVDALLSECLKATDDVVVSHADKLYDGSPEDQAHFDDLRRRYPAVRFAQYAVDVGLDLSRQPGVRHRPTAYWHNLARRTGIRAKRYRDWTLLLDADEIPEGARLREWWDASAPQANTAYKMANHWYFKSPRFRATTLEDSVLLLHESRLSMETVFGDFERDHTIRSSGARLVRNTRGLDGRPLFHHYSWCRSRAGLAHKLRNWAHRDDVFKGADVDELLDAIFKDDAVNDIVHRYQYQTVQNQFGIALE